jgi:hypothetical protein
MTFTPKTKKELDEAQLLPVGEYDFECAKAENAVSGPNSNTPGTAFIKLQLIVFTDNGNRYVNAMLHPAMERQVYNFCHLGNLVEAYESGKLRTEDCVGVVGRCKLKIEEKGGYPAKNVVGDYVAPKSEGVKAIKPAPVDGQPVTEDDVPF